MPRKIPEGMELTPKLVKIRLSEEMGKRLAYERKLWLSGADPQDPRTEMLKSLKYDVVIHCWTAPREAFNFLCAFVLYYLPVESTAQRRFKALGTQETETETVDIGERLRKEIEEETKPVLEAQEKLIEDRKRCLKRRIVPLSYPKKR